MPLARLVRPLLALTLVAALAPQAVAAGEGVSVSDLVRLAEAGAGEKLLSRLVADRGLERELGVDDILRLKETGFSDAFIEALVAGSGLVPAKYSVREEDGVLVVEGRGEVAAASRPIAKAGSSEPLEPPAATTNEPAATVSAPPPSVVIVQQGAPAPTSPPERGLDVGAPYPVGASFGVSGGAVFLPARFGDSPSSFGRTIVLDGVLPWGYHGSRGFVHPPHHGHLGHAPHAVRPPGSFSVETGHGTGGFTTIRTSRGTRSIPN